MNVYFVATFIIHDPCEYDRYENGFAETFAMFAGKI